MPALDDAAVLHQQDQVRAADGGQPVRDHERRSPGEQRRHRRLDQLLALGVEVARRLVEDQDLRRRQDRPRDRQPLLLAAGELHAALADERLVAVRQLDDELVRVGAPGGVLDLGVGRVVAAVGDVVAHRAVEQEHVLLHDAPAGRGSVRSRKSRMSVPLSRMRPLRRIVKPRHQVGHRRLARRRCGRPARPPIRRARRR